MNAKHLLTASALLCANLTLAQPVSDFPLQTSALLQQVSYQASSITKAEARQARIRLIVDNFERIDANHDGIVTRPEMRAFLLVNRRHAPMT